MPSSPEFCNAFAPEGEVEIEHEVIAHNTGSPYGNIGIAGKIAIHLVSKQEEGDQQVGRGVSMRIGIYWVGDQRHTVGNDYFFEQAPQHQPQAGYCEVIVECMFFAELVQHILRPLYGPGHQLRVKHDVERIDAIMPLGLLVATIYFYSIAHGLECMERQSDRQYDLYQEGRLYTAKGAECSMYMVCEKNSVLEKEQQAYIGGNAHNKERCTPAARALFNKYTCNIVDSDEEEQDEHVGRNEGHIKDTAGSEQMYPADLMRQQEVQ